MTKIIFYLTVFILLCMSKLHAQDPSIKTEKPKQSFESEVKSISTKIENITKEEKSALKTEVEAINVELENGKITKDEADAKKQKLADTKAKNIEDRVAVEQENLKNLIQQKVDGKIKATDSTHTSYTFYFPAMKVKNKNDKTEKRTTSQFVLAFGANNLVTNKAVANSDFYYWQSHFFEWGFTENTRIFKNHNLLHLKYGFSVMYNNLCPTDNRYFVTAPNSQTNLEVFPYELEDSRFKNVYLVAPLHLEFDFSGKKSNYGNSSFSTHKSVRFGIGGYGGFRIKSKQKMYYNIDDDKIRIKTKGDFNANDFIYGVSTYLGYKETSLYLKYDLNTLFENNAVDQNNISLGIRFDFN
ncbi:hypothetical protein [Flavobacterium alvei]|uniref:hypothetical protein n=1 Tax=Flavobacterium alvei TaxID=2080416 RepID=UPI0026EEB955|nr:hypothetical protein [Flavobacterium alvei]